MNTISLKYGTQNIEYKHNFKQFDIINKQELPGIDIAQIEKAIDNPIASPTLDKIIAEKGGDAVIVVSDITRKTGVHIYLPLIIERLIKAGIKEKDISIMFGNGTHRAMTEDEKEQIVGKEVYNRIELAEHNAFDESNLVSLGKTKQGANILINKKIMTTKHVILTGGVVFHYVAGFGGGRKSIIPGVAGFETIRANHLMAMSKEKGKGRADNVGSAILKNNPVHNDMVSIMKKVNPAFVVNAALNSSHEIIKVSAGDPHKAHLNLCEFFKRNYAIPIDNLYDIVIASCGGYPKDLNFIQSHKTMENAFSAVKDDGTLIVLAQCQQGGGSDEINHWLKFTDLVSMEEELYRNFAIYGQTVWATLCKTHKKNIVFVSTMDTEVIRSMKMTPATSLEQAVDIALKSAPKDPYVGFMPQGSLFLPLKS